MEFSLGVISDAIASAVPDRECIVQGPRRMTWREVSTRSRSLASFLSDQGLGAHVERGELKGWETGQDLLGVYMHNCPEYLESLLGAMKARLAPFNVNWRYGKDELRYLFNNAQASAIIYQAQFAPIISEILADVPSVKVLIQLDDGSGEPVFEGAVSYDEIMNSVSGADYQTQSSPDDLFVIYTGGTTGSPKGVLWRQADIFPVALGGRRRDGTEYESLDELVAAATKGKARALPAAPFMHGAATFNAFSALHSGGTVVLPPNAKGFDADEVARVIVDESVTSLLIVGDAFATPLVQALDRLGEPVTTLRIIASGGAALSPLAKRALLDRIPGVRILDAVGATETGTQGQVLNSVAAEGDANAKTQIGSGEFALNPGTCVVSENRDHLLAPGSDEIGWLATTGRMLLGYLGDPAKTSSIIATIDGERYTVAGDRAIILADGRVKFLGREAATINTGGEKVFAEEVEAVVKSDPSVVDVLVVGRPSARWGQEVVALVQLDDGGSLDSDALHASCRARLAGYKVPKQFVRVEKIPRSPAGKPDYAWAREQVGS
ncbi:MAG: AMP-binding protein [Acidimicrobiales bacterium]